MVWLAMPDTGDSTNAGFSPPLPPPPVVSPGRFLKLVPMFLDRNFKRLAKVNNYLPPFGFKTQGKEGGLLPSARSVLRS